MRATMTRLLLLLALGGSFTPPVDDPYFVETRDVVSMRGPRSITRNVLEDKAGNIWLATWQGIVRYDGKLFTNFTLKEGLRRFHVFSVLEDRAGNLWFGTIGGGVYRYDGKSFRRFTTDDGLADNSVACMLEDSAGNLWFGTEKGLSRYDGRRFRNFTAKEGLSSDSVNSIAQDRAGNLWFGTRGGVSRFDGNSITAFTDGEGMSFPNVRSIVVDKAGTVWMGGQRGLWRYEPGRKSLTRITKQFIGYLFEDRKGNLWVSGSAIDDLGMTLSRYDGKSFTEIAKRDRSNGGQIFGIAEDRSGNIWFGTMDGVWRYDGRSLTGFF